MLNRYQAVNGCSARILKKGKTRDFGGVELSLRRRLSVAEAFMLLIQLPLLMLQEVGMEGLLDLGMLLLWRYPNADPGSVRIRKVRDRRRMQVLRGQVFHKILW